MDQVDGQPQAFTGRGIAQTGFVLGIIGTTLAVLFVLILVLAVVSTA